MNTTGSRPAVRRRRMPSAHLAAAVLPPLLLAAAGLAHPHGLVPATADRWVALHLALVPVFPLLALGPWLTVVTFRPAVRAVVAVPLLAYATFYGALDAVAGIGAGSVARATDDPVAVRALFAAGKPLEWIGSIGYLVASVLVVAALLARARAAALPGAVLVLLGSVSFLDSHIYWPRGVLTMVVLALGWGLLVLLPARAARPSSR